MSTFVGNVTNDSKEESENDMYDEDSANFHFDLADSNLTISEDENIVHVLSSCTDEVAQSLDSISSSSMDVNLRDTLDNEVMYDIVDSRVEIAQTFDLSFRTKAGDNSQTTTNDTCEVTTLNDVPERVESPPIEISSKGVSQISIISGEGGDKLNSTDKKTEVGIDLAKQNVYSRKKLKKITMALKDGDVGTLRKAAVSRGGLLNDSIRKKVWPILVGVDIVEASPRPSLKEIEAHPYYNQVVLDVNRSLKRFPPSIKEAQRLTMLDQLVFLIMRVLCKHPNFHYYQGYHDICVTFLLVLGEETAFHVVEKLSRTHLNIFMEKNMEPTIHLLEHKYVLIGKKSPQLNNFLIKSEVGVAYCLSWLITWFGHVLNEYDNVVRLFDFFIVSHPWMPIYLTAAVVLHRELEVLNQECDMACVHSLLSNIPEDLPFEELILHSLNLHESYSPKLLDSEHPYVKKIKLRPKKGWSLLNSVTKTIKFAVPATGITVPVVIAAAVLVTAVLYQAYKY